jgi:peptidoglycan/xylan/chitin deacetylase (PgdA/CDA1 family)
VARKEESDDGPSPGRALLAALVVGGSLFAGIHWSDEASALVNGQRTRHVVELIPASEVGKTSGKEDDDTPPHTARKGGDPDIVASDRSNPSDQSDGAAGEGKSGDSTRHPREIARGPAGGRKVALTFDAGSSGVPLPAILAALRKTGQHCTFFVTGRWAEAHPDLVRAIVAGGHELGNHTYSHADLTRLSDEEIASELRRTEEAVRDACGKSTRPYFRPPLGARNERVLRVAAREGYQTVYWSTDSLDSVIKDITPEAIRERVADRARAGAIVLLHCGSQATAQALPALLEDLRDQGLSVATISDLLGQ